MSLLSDLGTKIGTKLKELTTLVNTKLDKTGTATDSSLLDGQAPSFYLQSSSGGIQSKSDFVNGTLVSSSIVSSGTSGDSFIIEITGKSYTSGNAPYKVIIQGYIYNDTFINYSGMSYGGNFTSVKILNDVNGKLAFWWPRISYWNSFEVTVKRVSNPDSTPDNLVTSITDVVEPASAKKVTLTPFQVYHTGNLNLSNLGGKILQVAHGIETQARDYVTTSNFELIGTNATFTPISSNSTFLVTFQCATNTSDDVDAGAVNQNGYWSGLVQRRLNLESFVNADMVATGTGSYRSSHIELSPNRTGSEDGGTYEQGQRYRSKQHSIQIIDAPLYTLGDSITFRMLVQRHTGNHIRFGEPHGFGTDEIYPSQVYGFTIMEIGA